MNKDEIDLSYSTTEPLMILTIDIGNGQIDKLYISSKEKYQEETYDFCMRNKLDYETMKNIKEEIVKVMEKKEREDCVENVGKSGGSEGINEETENINERNECKISGKDIKETTDDKVNYGKVDIKNSVHYKIKDSNDISKTFSCRGKSAGSVRSKNRSKISLGKSKNIIGNKNTCLKKGVTYRNCSDLNKCNKSLNLNNAKNMTEKVSKSYVGINSKKFHEEEKCLTSKPKNFNRTTKQHFRNNSLYERGILNKNKERQRLQELRKMLEIKENRERGAGRHR